MQKLSAREPNRSIEKCEWRRDIANLLVQAPMCAHMRIKPVIQRPVTANRYPRRPSQLDITGSPTRAIKKRKNKQGWRETGRRETERERKRERERERDASYMLLACILRPYKTVAIDRECSASRWIGVTRHGVKFTRSKRMEIFLYVIIFRTD